MYLLLIEDSCPVIERLTELFSTQPGVSGFLSVRASDFTTAVSETFIPDIVLLGVTYPLATSFNLLTCIATAIRPAALIMLDNGTDQYIHLHFFKHGATHVIDTYNDFGELLHIVKGYKEARDRNTKT
jgi:chemotaxis response regulator CheB